MEVQPDFRDMLALLNRHKVEFIIVGSYALAFHGAPRNTGDIDIYLRPTPENAVRVLTVLKDFGFDSLGLNEKDFSKPDQVIQLGTPPVRIDFLTSLTGVSWEAADSGKAVGRYGDVPVPYLGLDEYRTNKKALGRNRDLADLEALGEE